MIKKRRQEREGAKSVEQKQIAYKRGCLGSVKDVTEAKGGCRSSVQCYARANNQLFVRACDMLSVDLANSDNQLIAEACTVTCGVSQAAATSAWAGKRHHSDTWQLTGMRGAMGGRDTHRNVGSCLINCFEALFQEVYYFYEINKY